MRGQARKNLRKQIPEVFADCGLVSVEVARPALNALALGALSDVLYFTIFKEGLHCDFTAARAVETVGRTGCTRVLADRSHSKTPWFSVRFTELCLEILAPQKGADWWYILYTDPEKAGTGCILGRKIP